MGGRAGELGQSLLYLAINHCNARYHACVQQMTARLPKTFSSSSSESASSWSSLAWSLGAPFEPLDRIELVDFNDVLDLHAFPVQGTIDKSA